MSLNRPSPPGPPTLPGSMPAAPLTPAGRTGGSTSKARCQGCAWTDEGPHRYTNSSRHALETGHITMVEYTGPTPTVEEFG